MRSEIKGAIVAAVFGLLFIIVLAVSFPKGSKSDYVVEHKQGNVSYNLTEYYLDGLWYYVVDNNTNIVYLMRKGDRSCGLTALLDSSGNVVRKEDLGLE